jgi:hypothetical protein
MALASRAIRPPAISTSTSRVPAILARRITRSFTPWQGTLRRVAGRVPFDDAAALLDEVRAGAVWDGPIPDPPIMVVDLEAGRPRPAATPKPRGAPLRAPALWPCVVVAVGTSATSPPPGADLYLAGDPRPPRPWVGAGALDQVVEKVARIVGEKPRAAVTLIQTLRSRTGDVEIDLITESLAYAALQWGPEHRNWLATLPPRTTDPLDSDALILDRSGDTLSVVLNRPERRNAYSARMRDELVCAFQLAAADDSILSVRLRADGPGFCSGGDLAEFGTVEDPATAHAIRMARNAGWWAHLIAPKLAVRVHGACVGAGVELPAFAGRVIASPGTTFRLPEVGMGLIPGAGGTASIPRRIGRERTAWLALSGCDLDAATAEDWGLVDGIEGPQSGN